jgi:hypothetical protein
MKTYRTPGATATEWSPTGNGQEVQRLETVTGVGSDTMSIPLTMSLSGETTRKGIRRVVLRSTAVLPAVMMNAMMGPNAGYDPRGSTPISVHVVVQAPQIVSQGETAMAYDGGVNGLIAKMVQDIVAVLSNESLTASSDLKPDASPAGLVYRALSGAAALDVVSGAYGESSARS